MSTLTRRRPHPGTMKRIATAFGDFPPVYTAWVASVKQNGGVATVWPAKDSNYGKPAARYDIGTLDDLSAVGIFPNIGTWSADSQYGYELAPANVAAAATQLTQPTSSEINKAASALPNPFGLPDFSKVMKYGGILLGVGAALYLVLPLLKKRS